MVGAPYMTLADVKVARVLLQVPSTGAWVADVDGADPLPASGKVILKIGDAAFVGTIDPRFAGSFGAQKRVRVVAGAGGWSSTAPAQHLHNDAGVKVSQVLALTALAVGEDLVFTPPDAVIGADFIRLAGPASDTLRLLGTRWHIDYAGKTQVGPRVVPPLGPFTLLDFDAREKVATIAVDDVTAVQVGAVLTDARLAQPFTVAQLEIRADLEGMQIVAWGVQS